MNEDTYLLPGVWNELTTGQLLYLIKLVGKQLSAEEIKLKMLLKILNARVHSYNGTDGAMLFVIKTGKKKYELSAEQMHSITAIFDYLFTEEKGVISINPLMTKNPFPALKIGEEIFDGAGEGLDDITYEQFVYLMTYFQQMQTEPEKINDFIAVIYKPEAKLQHIAKLPAEVKTAITWYYLGSMAFMSEKFPVTFSGSGSSTSGTSVFENQMRVIDNDLTKKQIVKNSLLYDALFTMEIAAENAEKVKKMMILN